MILNLHYVHMTMDFEEYGLSVTIRGSAGAPLTQVTWLDWLTDKTLYTFGPLH